MTNAAMTPITLCVFAKPPVPGQAKTRLARTVGRDAAADLARAFFDDTLAGLVVLPWAHVIVALAAPWPACPFPGGQIWLQGPGDLGQKMEAVLARALARGLPVMALGTDAPGLPVARLEAARDLLLAGRAEAVLGPADDGGFYLLGLSSCPPGVLHDLPWSVPETCGATAARLQSRGMSVALVESWFDVDDEAGLRRLSHLLARGEVSAPRTAEVIARLGMGLR